MGMTARWSVISPSQFPWKREAFQWPREHLPDASSYSDDNPLLLANRKAKRLARLATIG